MLGEGLGHLTHAAVVLAEPATRGDHPGLALTNDVVGDLEITLLRDGHRLPLLDDVGLVVTSKDATSGRYHRACKPGPPANTGTLGIVPPRYVRLRPAARTASENALV